MPLPPEVNRLVPELFRRVSIPYYKGFSEDNQRALSGIVTTGLAGHRAARKQLVANRLKGAPDGGSHLDEFAVSFGFLEEASGNYVVGRYGLVGEYLRNAASRHRQFSQDRAVRALLIYALLDRHGDCLVPLLALIREREQTAAFAARVSATLLRKAEVWRLADLPRNAAYREGVRLYGEYANEWQVPSPWPQRVVMPRYARRPLGLSEKTVEGYLGRTVAYATDLKLVAGAAASLSLTAPGEALAAALSDEGLAPSANIGLPPTFEAIHDAFSIDYGRYASAFVPLTHGGVERLVSSAVLPYRERTSWEEVPDIGAEYGQIVSSLSEALSGSARLDSVRLAMFLYAVGRGVAPVLDNGPLGAPGGAFELNENAAVRLASTDTRKYALGHARSGRRLWSVSLLRK